MNIVWLQSKPKRTLFFKDCSRGCMFGRQPGTVPHRTNRTLVSAGFLVIVVLCSVLFVTIPLFPRDLARIRAIVKVFISILFQDKNPLLKPKCYKAYAAVYLVIVSYSTCSIQSLYIHPPYYLPYLIFPIFLICLFHIILRFLSCPSHLTPLLSYGSS